MGGPPRGVRETPPAFGQTKGQVNPSLALRRLEQDEHSVWGKQPTHVASVWAKVTRRVQDVCGQDQIEGARGKALTDVGRARYSTSRSGQTDSS